VDLLGQEDHQVCKALLVWLDHLDPLDHPETLGNKACLDLRVAQVLLDHKDLQGPMEQMA
jgi:hypothetical protein